MLRKSKRPLIRISMVLAWAKKVVNLAPLCGVCRRLESVLGAEERLGIW
jgi:hypothetical protein